MTDKNLYSYCDNNPVMRADDDGHCWHILIGGAIGFLVGGGISLISQLQDNGGDFDKVNWGVVIANGGASALSGALAASGVGLIGQTAGGAAISMGDKQLNKSSPEKQLRKQDLLSMVL